MDVVVAIWGEKVDVVVELDPCCCCGVDGALSIIERYV